MHAAAGHDPRGGRYCVAFVSGLQVVADTGQHIICVNMGDEMGVNMGDGMGASV